MKILNPVIFVAPDFLGTNLTNQSRSMTLKTRQRRTKQTAPKVQLIASVKNSVKKFASMLETKDTIAQTGRIIKQMTTKGLKKLSFALVIFFIMRILSKLAIDMQIPMPQTSAFIPTYFGKNQIETSKSTAPKI